MNTKLVTRKKIMQAALDMFSQYGYYQTSLRMIANVAGVNELTVYRHFGTKQKLFLEATDNKIKEYHIEELFDEAKSANSFEKAIEILAFGYRKFTKENEKVYRIQMSLMDEERDLAQRILLSRTFYKLLSEYFREIKGQDLINGDPKMMSIVFVNMMIGAVTIHVLTEDTFSDVDVDSQFKEQAILFSKCYKK